MTLRLSIVVAIFTISTACVSLQDRDTQESPVAVVGTKGKVSQAQGDALVTSAVARAPDPEAMERLVALMATISEGPLYKDNQVRLLVDGPNTYAAMLAAIESATRHIHLETYIFSDDEVGDRFADALIHKSSQGVEVRIIYDSLGSKASSTEFFDRMKAADIDFVEFHPVNPAKGGNPVNANVRDHRKLLVVDGEVAFTGGINLDKSYSSSSRRRRAPKNISGWRDTHIEVRGPAVAGFQRLFLTNWKEEGGELPAEESGYFPKDTVQGKHLVRVLSAIGGEGDVSPIRIAYGMAMEAASDRIWITQSYFGPDPDFLRMMTDAATRGVDVRIIVTGLSDAPLLLHLSRSCYGELLRAGVRVYESTTTMLHAKTAVIDGVWSTVGSSNLDYRSFIHNYEVNAVIVGQEFGSSVEKMFEADLGHSKAISLDDWNDRPLADRFKEKLSRLFKYWL